MEDRQDKLQEQVSENITKKKLKTKQHMAEDAGYSPSYAKTGRPFKTVKMRDFTTDLKKIIASRVAELLRRNKFDKVYESSLVGTIENLGKLVQLLEGDATDRIDVTTKTPDQLLEILKNAGFTKPTGNSSGGSTNTGKV